MQNNILKSAHRWYMDDITCDIIDPDGWRDVDDVDEQKGRWFYKPITFSEYSIRRGRSTIGKYNMLQHRAPYTFRFNYVKYMPFFTTFVC